MTAKTEGQAAANSVKRTERRERQGIKRVIYFTGQLKCQRCPLRWDVVDLNPERKVVSCPVCGEQNDIREAIKRAL